MKSRISSIALLFAATTVAAHAAECPAGTPPQITEVRDTEIRIFDTPLGLVCHSAILRVSVVDPTTGTVGSVFDAQIDTGADFTIVGPEAIDGLHLSILGKEEILKAGVQGSEVKVKSYKADIKTISGKQVPVRLLVTSKSTRPLLGRDFLANFTLTYDGKSGQVWLK